MDHKTHLLIILAIILFLARISEAISKKIKIPPVIGLLLLGVALGPSVTGFIVPNEIISWLAKFGVLFLLFEAGLETDLSRLKKDSKTAFLPALGGILLPFGLGVGFSLVFENTLIQSLIIGVIFTATSVSISVVTLMELGKLKSIEGRTIINSAILDDIIGILLLTVIFGFTVSSDKSSFESEYYIIISIVKIVLFFLIIFVVGKYIIRPLFQNLGKFNLESAFLTITISFIFLYAWLAEQTGIAAITGAYFAGLFLGQTELKSKINEGISVFGKTFFIDIFFINIGLEFNLAEISASPLFLIIFVLLAILGKILGVGLGCRFSNFDNIRAFRIGSGMIPRGEVALIVANMAVQRHIISHNVTSAAILMVIISAIMTPFLLKFGFKRFQQKTF